MSMDINEEELITELNKLEEDINNNSPSNDTDILITNLPEAPTTKLTIEKDNIKKDNIKKIAVMN